MIQPKQPKKVKGARKKMREELLVRLELKYPTWFEGRTDKEIKALVTSFRLSGRSEDEFPAYCIEWEAKMESISTILSNDFHNIMRSATVEEQDSVQNYIDSISKPTGVNFYDYLGGK